QRLVDRINNARRIQRIKTEMRNKQRCGFSLCDRRMRVEKFYPSDIEHFPVPDGFLCCRKDVAAYADLNSIAVDAITRRSFFRDGRTKFRVRERLRQSGVVEICDLCIAGPCEMEH